MSKTGLLHPELAKSYQPNYGWRQSAADGTVRDEALWPKGFDDSILIACALKLFNPKEVSLTETQADQQVRFPEGRNAGAVGPLIHARLSAGRASAVRKLDERGRP